MIAVTGVDGVIHVAASTQIWPGKAPKISYPMARLANEDCYYSNKKAVEELLLLDYENRSLDRQFQELEGDKRNIIPKT